VAPNPVFRSRISDRELGRESRLPPQTSFSDLGSPIANCEGKGEWPPTQFSDLGSPIANWESRDTPPNHIYYFGYDRRQCPELTLSAMAVRTRTRWGGFERCMFCVFSETNTHHVRGDGVPRHSYAHPPVCCARVHRVRGLYLTFEGVPMGTFKAA
jgi:hypothetical protein